MDTSGDSSRDPTADLVSIFRAGLDRADPEALVRAQMVLRGTTLTVGVGADTTVHDLAGYRRVILLAAGKASARMARAAAAILGSRLDAGVVVTKHGQGEAPDRCVLVEAGHPVPDEASVRAADLVGRAADQADERCLVIGLISGGASALLAAPLGVTLAEKRQVTRELLACGATIHEINTVRKHLSSLKGGRLAARLYPACSVHLVLSDVVGDDLDVIGSGLTTPDRSTFSDALDTLRARGILERVPRAARAALEGGAAGEHPESPKPGDRVFRDCRTLVVGSNLRSAQAAAARARELGYHTLLLTSRLQGEARDAAGLFLALARDAAAAGHPVPLPGCVIAGGETTVTLRGDGVGGRNQELALAFLAGLSASPLDSRASLLAASTDGADGPTDAAGALVTPQVRERAAGLGLEPAVYLARNDSHTFFDRCGGLLRTGATGTNVCDLTILVVR